MEKSADAFRTISEVADILQTPAHVLRFWESRFSQIKPVKRAGGRRYYRPSDVALLAGIRKLLHDDGMTIRGVQKILREQGIRKVSELARDEEAAFIELEAEEERREAEVHPFPQRRMAAQVTADAAGWTFSPSTGKDGDDPMSEKEFFAKAVAADNDANDDGPPPPLRTADAGLARERAQRLRQQPEVAPMPARPLPVRILGLETAMDQAALTPVLQRLLALRERMGTDSR